ncbi:MAG: DUF3987 domain-containing protein [Acinetobacter sp.]
MNELIQRAPYPVHVLPPMLKDFAQQVVASTQSTYEMVVPVMLAGMSAAVQGVAHVRTPYDEVKPVSLFTSVIAKSGDRKSSVLKKVMKEFDDFERRRSSVAKDAGGNELRSHQFIIEDATNKGVTDIFKNGAYSLFYALDEGAILFKNLDLASFIHRFDGKAINEVSRSHGATILHDRHVALCMLTQDITFERWVSKKTDLLIESGFMPRMLISQSVSGSTSTRWIEALSAEELDKHAFHQRVRALMIEYAKSIGMPEIYRKTIGFSPVAKAVWMQYQNEAEQLLRVTSDWAGVDAFIRRSGEIVCRVAAVLQHFIDPSQDVQEWSIRAAIDVVCWHLGEAKRIFGNDKELLNFQSEVDGLYSYMLRRVQRTGCNLIPRSEILRCGPVSVRKALVLDAVIENLVMQGKIIKVVHEGKTCLQILNIFNFYPTENFSAYIRNF